MTETLVCLDKVHVDGLNLAEGFTALASTDLAKIFDPERIWLGPRGALETDERYRQLVSYVVVRWSDSVLIYRRTPKGGESRLHGRLSVGIGGHWNVSDVTSEDGAVEPMATLRRACERELAEEIECGSPERIQVVGVIKESANAVSRVHLGVVIECWLSSPRVSVRDHGICETRFVTASALASLAAEMETWSASLVPYLNDCAARAKLDSST
jgi:predicted NUDIX family phosphoesterase